MQMMTEPYKTRKVMTVDFFIPSVFVLLTANREYENIVYNPFNTGLEEEWKAIDK